MLRRRYTLAATSAVVFAINVFATCVSGRVMRWVPNTDFDNPSNWKVGRLPCQNEHVRFPPSVTSVFVQRNNTVLEIILPNDGEIILGPDVALLFQTSSNVDASCPERENVFNGSTAKSWYDPDNWCEMPDIDSDNCFQDKPRLLHTESIPCSYDDVIFPLATRFVVDVATGAEINVNSVHIGTEPLTQRALRQFLSTEAGRRQFVRSSSSGRGVDTAIRVSGQSSCNDISGCLCNNDKLKDKVCGTQQSNCPRPVCQNALEPRGHCCHICGALLDLEVSAAFRMKTLSAILKNMYQQPVTKRSTRGENVYWIISKVDTGIEMIIQVAIADNGDGENAVKIAYKLKEELQKDMKGRRRYGVTHIEMHVSGTVSPEAGKQTGEDSSTKSTSIAVSVVVIIALLVALGIAAWCYLARRRGTKMTLPNVTLPTFARWRSGSDGTSSRGDMELGGRGVVFDNKILYDDANVTSFENIGFGNVLSLQFDPLEVQPTDGARGSYANPLYGEEPGVQEIISQSSSKRPPGEIARTKMADNVFGDAVGQLDQQQQSSSVQAPVSISSRVAGVFRGRRADSSSGHQRFENEENDDDENDNVKTQSRPELEQRTAGKDVKTTKDARAEKKRVKKKTGEKHQRLEEDSDETEHSGESKQSSRTKDKGISNPCYDVDATPASTTKPVQQPAEFYQARRGFNNPVFVETSRHIEGVEEGDSNA